MGVALGIFLTLPKAQGKDLVGLGIRYKQNLVNESLLTFKDWKDLVLNGFGKLSHFSRFGIDRDNSGKHSVPPFRKVHGQTKPILDRFKGQLPKNGARSR